ncbi:MAG: SurA N-terminal domain-containing protein [Acidobacteria bacterium]|nr:SurA N-terminal domain-containing protein [Acidobacteriota bacterium]
MRRILLSLLFFTLAASASAQGQTRTTAAPARGQSPAVTAAAAPVQTNAPAASTGAEVVDRMVAVINGRELITYSDLLWQLALQADAPLDNPRQEDLRRVLDTLVDQRLIAQEAEKLPSVTPTAEEVRAELTRIIGFFPSQSEFYRRLNRVGLGEDSEQLREIVQDRVVIRKYLDFRFRSFTIVTPQEVEAFYHDVYVPRRRRQSPGTIIPKLEEATAQIQNELIESKIESDIDAFLEEARTTAEITILN